MRCFSCIGLSLLHGPYALASSRTTQLHTQRLEPMIQTKDQLSYDWQGQQFMAGSGRSSESRKAIECMFSWEVVPEPFLQYPLVPKLGYTSCEKELPIQTAIMKIDIMDLL